MHRAESRLLFCWGRRPALSVLVIQHNRPIPWLHGIRKVKGHTQDAIERNNVQLDDCTLSGG